MKFINQKQNANVSIFFTEAGIETDSKLALPKAPYGITSTPSKIVIDLAKPNGDII